MINHSCDRSTAGAGTAPTRYESVSKHAQTTNPINKFDFFNDSIGGYVSGAEVVILGWDPQILILTISGKNWLTHHGVVEILLLLQLLHLKNIFGIKVGGKLELLCQVHIVHYR